MQHRHDSRIQGKQPSQGSQDCLTLRTEIHEGVVAMLQRKGRLACFGSTIISFYKVPHLLCLLPVFSNDTWTPLQLSSFEDLNSFSGH